MNEQDDTKLWQILGHASQPAPGDDFARKVMMRMPCALGELLRRPWWLPSSALQP